MKMKKIGYFALFALMGVPVFATTWDEPWHNEVVKNADSFILARIDSFDTKTGVNITVKKTISGKEITGSIKIMNFYLLQFTSFSDDSGVFSHFSGAREGYLFIKQNANGDFCIATPTTGFAIVQSGTVYATYRHSYHQALVPIDVYEKTMEAIFNSIYINEYIIAMKNVMNAQTAHNRSVYAFCPAGLTGPAISQEPRGS
jgi:hypothetical protein